MIENVNKGFNLFLYQLIEFEEGYPLCLLVKSVAEEQRIITVSVDKDLIQEALVCFIVLFCVLNYH